LLKSIKYQSKEISYYDEGKGRSIILLHGFAEDHFIWNRQVDFFKNKCRLIVPDLPGSGLSEILKDMSIEGMAACIIQLISETCTPKDLPYLIGHSMGGYIALAVAEKNPGRLAGLGLFHSTAYPDSPEKKIGRNKSIEFIRQHGSDPFIRQSIPNLFSESSKKYDSDIIETLIRRFGGFSPESLVSYYEAMIKRPDRTSVLKHFPGPVLFVIGAQDAAIPADDILKQCHLPSISHIHIFENTAHMGMLENTTRSDVVLEEFVNA
jgi:pimeloyl-ACP methyl ester carboxylesterase